MAGPESAIDPLDDWVERLKERHLASLRWSEVRRGIQALSAIYVEERDRLLRGAALDGAGKRAGFALFYAPLHFLVVREILRGLGAARFGGGEILDLGCGTGAAGAAWALEGGGRVEGVDVNGWAIDEARHTFRDLGVRGRARKGNLDRVPLPGAGSAIILAYTLNELDDATRDGLRAPLLDAARRGAAVLVIEPIAKRSVPWWGTWAKAFAAQGGSEREWRFRPYLPPTLRELDRSAGLDHSILKGRSLWMPGKE